MKTKYSYAVVKSVFGDIWVGKSKHKADEKRFFSDIEDAYNKAEDYFCEQHPDFDFTLDEDDEGYNDELVMLHDEIRNPDLDEIKETMEKFVI